jgi:4-alpha-glucanotransferase
LADYSSADSVAAVVSPYSPLSRMWWNEAFLDLARVPGVHSATAAEWAEPEPGPYSDVARAAAHVRSSLASLIARAHPGRGDRLADYEAFRRERPDVVRYAAFRAAASLHGIDRDAWPARFIAGDIRPGVDVDRDEVELHVCAQWLTDTQIGDVAASTASTGCRLMLDLPIGCRPDGYDTWAFPSSFAGGSPQVHAPNGASVGAPPDRFFSGGQDWGFRPLDPEGERHAGYPVVQGCFAHLLRHAGALRIDHVLGFQRLWWIPSGASARDGTYVSYPAEELLALACLEAWRHDATLIGEDLGTVDPAVRSLLGEHGIAGMSVAVFDLEARPGQRLEPPAGSCALVDTHDTATFAGWLDGTDIEDRLHLGLEDVAVASSERAARSRAVRGLLDRFGDTVPDARSVHARLLEELGSSQAGVVIATLEDLWAEHDPQNIPGTTAEHVNFARRASATLPAIERDEAVIATLRRLDAARHAAAGRLQPPASEAYPARGGACSSPAAGKVCR